MLRGNSMKRRGSRFHKENSIMMNQSDFVPSEAIYASHNLHEVTMYYPMRLVRTKQYKLLHNMAAPLPFMIDQDFYISPTFQDILNRTRSGQPLPWYKSLHQYYHRPLWELYDLHDDPKELNNLATSEKHAGVLSTLQNQLFEWMNATYDPWICSPWGVYEASGPYKEHPRCMPLNNGLNIPSYFSKSEL